jgi:hypothetical protein
MNLPMTVSQGRMSRPTLFSERASAQNDQLSHGLKVANCIFFY